MAMELARRGIPYRIIDVSRSATDKSKAIGIQARTLELFDNVGITAELTAAGKKAIAANVYHDDSKLLRLTFAELESPYPYILMLPQNETEAILIDHIERLGGTVEREVKLKTFVEDSEGVTATLEHADGTTESVRTPWLIGCDGAHSTVRHLLNQPFLGEEFEEGFQLADVKILWLLKDDEIYIFVHGGWLLAAFPLPDGRHRLIADVPPELAPVGENPTLEDWQRLLDERLPVRATLSDPHWTANYRIHRRLVTKLKVGRAFLVGDSAHIHSPAGAQGMNTGIQDAFNLAWKLAAVVKGTAKESLLDSYHDERYPVEKSVLAATDLPLHVLGLTNPIAQAARDRFMPLLAGLEVVQQKVRGVISELAVQYSGSAIVEENALGGGPKAGERAPMGAYQDSDGSQHQLFDLLGGPAHKLLIFEPIKPESNQTELNSAITSAAMQYFGDQIKIIIFPSAQEKNKDSEAAGHHDSHGTLHERYAARRGAVYLIRPDGYIGFRCPLATASEHLQPYLDRIFLPVNDES
jgi:2-polyprenyl-6-methoxyphenol hydroxylase-like FAD-dependent oxidoreductase